MVTETVRPVGTHDAPIRPYDSAFAQLCNELQWLSLRLRVAVERSRRRRSVGPAEEYRGLYVADDEIDVLLSTDPHPNSDSLEAVVAAAAVLRRLIDARTQATLGGGIISPLDHLTRVFDLTNDERAILVIALAPHVDLGYEKVFAHANDDITHKRPSTGLAFDVLADDPEARITLRPLLYGDAPLLRNRLVRLVDEQQHGEAPLLTRTLELDPHIAELILGHPGHDPRLSSVVASHDGALTESPEAAAFARVLASRPDARIYVGGRWRREKREAAAAGCHVQGLEFIRVDLSALMAAAGWNDLLPLAFRDARIQHAVLYFDGWEPLARDDDQHLRSLSAALLPFVLGHPLPVFFAGRADTAEGLPVPPHLQVVLAEPRFEEREQHWHAFTTLSPSERAHIAATFRLGVEEIGAATTMASSLAAWRGHALPSLGDVQVAARLQARPRLSTLAKKIEPRVSWDDIVLPREQLTQLREIADQVLYRDVVYGEWGFGAKASLGRGIAALFCGPSGTGKTMAAEVIAGELGLDLYKIDLSGLVSKYIGETEKNLSRLFDEAADSSAILFFDEADAVFGKRTEVSDSHDRYANIEVSYLLQKIEEYDGIVVMATNLRANIDEAFLRRMRSVVEFPLPGEEDRLRIWQRLLSGAVPIAGDVDVAFMARQFRIAGGNIKNIALLAAFLAAGNGDTIGMVHMVRAARREYQKLGRLVTPSDFGEWHGEAGM